MSSFNEIEEEMLSHIDENELIMEDDEVLSSAFILAENSMLPYNGLPEKVQDVGRDNLIRVLSTAIALLESYTPEENKEVAN